MKRYWILFLILNLSTTLLNSYSIVFIHLGLNLPEYCIDSIKQARLFNQECKIYLITNKENINQNKKLFSEISNFDLIESESLIPSKAYLKFLENSTLIKNNSGNFWVYTNERFFYLGKFIEQYNMQDVFHLENDVMLYVDLSSLLPTFKQYYKGLAAVFDNDDRCIASFMYIPNENAIDKLVNFFADNAHLGLFDMHMIAKFKNSYPNNFIDNLPIIMNDYIIKHGLFSTNNHTSNNFLNYSKNSSVFNSIFDAAAIGQYLGGIDHIHYNNGPGFINETCLFNVSYLTYQWQADNLGRSVPYAIFNNKKYKINNLHIHSKELKKFSSLNQDLITSP